MIQREFIPGSNWLYFKLYTGFKSADTVLISRLYPVLMALRNNREIKDFFFIRYFDPDPHIRLRLRIYGSDRYTTIFEAMYRSLSICMAEGLLNNVMCDTYRRELERYGENTMELSELFFCIDSRHILGLLDKLQHFDSPEQVRWQISLRLLDDLSEAAGYDIVTRSRLMEKISRSFITEFMCDKQPYSGQLNNKYRVSKPLIEHVMRRGSLPAVLENRLDSRKKELEPIFQQIDEMNRQSRLQVPLDRLLTSYMHMTMNRWFRSKNRVYELVIYNFLARHYKSVIARQKR